MAPAPGSARSGRELTGEVTRGAGSEVIDVARARGIALAVATPPSATSTALSGTRARCVHRHNQRAAVIERHPRSVATTSTPTAPETCTARTTRAPGRAGTAASGTTPRMARPRRTAAMRASAASRLAPGPRVAATERPTPERGVRRRAARAAEERAPAVIRGPADPRAAEARATSTGMRAHASAAGNARVARARAGLDRAAPVDAVEGDHKQ